MAVKRRYSYLIKITGIVQGVGFRPFIFNLANKMCIPGAVSNTTEGVLIKINVRDRGEAEGFVEEIKKSKPAAAVIENICIKQIPYETIENFKIEKSKETGIKFQLVSPDIATCSKCIKDIFNKDSANRYHYPFTNCTNCGPRFTIIREMPYDRPNTTMKKFNLCKDCSNEYNDPLDRRFHAQPNACKKCGPKLVLTDNRGNFIDNKDPIKTAVKLIGDGKIIGLKSLGGFQIACDATSDVIIKKIRDRKRRPSKPFAIMAQDTRWIEKYYHLSTGESSSLKSTRAPIVLLKKKEGDYPLSYFVSLYNKWEGIMLPYTPIHHILFEYIDIPLIMTSGNIAEEPIASDNIEARDRLKPICDYYLVHNRDIYSRYDDSVIKFFRKKEMVLRRARGYSPYPVKIDENIGKKFILSVGAHEKNTFTILTRNYAIVSQHIGDLDSYQSMEFFNSTFENYKRLFGVNDFEFVVHDKHPDYGSTKFARQFNGSNSMLIKVQHHKAHIASVIAENNLKCDLLGFAWDGTGYGDDGKVWGSEIFKVDRNLEFTRTGHLMEKLLPGGSITIEKPYRMCLVYLNYLWKKNMKDKESFRDFVYRIQPAYKDIIEDMEIKAIEGQVKSGFNSPVTTSMGRLFDAVSSLLGLTHISSFEGEAAIHLEMAMEDKNINEFLKNDTRNIENKYRYDTGMKNKKGDFIINDFYIFSQILEDLENGNKKSEISFKFHNTLAQIILDTSIYFRLNKGIETIVLSGGVFQNNYLTEICFKLLEINNFKVYSNFKVPVNDGGISLGQAYMAAFRKILSKERSAHICV